MKTMFINPPLKVRQRADFPPPALLYLSSVLKKAGKDVCVCDACSLSSKKLGAIIMGVMPDIIGISCWTTNRSQAFKTAKLARKLLPNVKIIVGGYHATAFPEHMFQKADADVVVMGEAEETIVELIDAFENGAALSDVKGIAFMEEGTVRTTERRPLIENIDDVPFPDYSDIDLDRYLGLPENSLRATFIITSRGCPHRCIFCSSSSFWHKKWRCRSPENVAEEIKWLYHKHNVRAFIFFDDNFTVNEERSIDICRRIIENNLQIKWTTSSHVNHITRDLLRWMKKAGCYRIDFGVESGSPEILEYIRKKQTVDRIKKTFELVHSEGILPRPYLLVGCPGENHSTIQQTVELMKKIKPFAATATLLKVLPETEIYNFAKQKALIDDDFWLHSDDEVLYTAEHSVKELYKLRNELMRGLALNDGTFRAIAEYIAKSAFHRFPILQKFRSVKRLFYSINQ